ncbi:EI24 domain-containing protein [Polaribacter butkevichii]|uniref:Coproporphyrinogen III oxidase n=1 Tax=Polaribacter butkevichii TaxID=218490 RepID=A0A2P6CEV8_9FLAO|nr:EI24 domain-containing protein [Polaribacter butkevichii]PQJ73434.1 coproporphyrinogen III oxidase [Polaribacter butkevichii]
MIKNILSGIQAYVGSFGLISKLKLWKYFIVPVVISLVTATIIGFTAYGLSDNIGNFLAKIWIWDWGKETVTTIASFIGAVFVLVIGFLLYKHIVMALSAPFMSPVSEKIETHLNGSFKHNHRKTTFREQLIRGVRISLRNLSKEILFTIPLLLLSFIPIIGLVFTVVLFLVQAYYAGFGNMDYTLERHLNYKESINFVGKNKGVSIGNGIVFMLCLLIPVLGFIIVLPLSVTAASVKTVALLNKENERAIL